MQPIATIATSPPIRKSARIPGCAVPENPFPLNIWGAQLESFHPTARSVGAREALVQCEQRDVQRLGECHVEGVRCSSPSREAPMRARAAAGGPRALQARTQGRRRLDGQPFRRVRHADRRGEPRRGPRRPRDGAQPGPRPQPVVRAPVQHRGRPEPPQRRTMRQRRASRSSSSASRTSLAPTPDERRRVDASHAVMLGRAASRVASARNSSGTLTPSSAARLRRPAYTSSSTSRIWIVFGMSAS